MNLWGIYPIGINADLHAWGTTSEPGIYSEIAKEILYLNFQ